MSNIAFLNKMCNSDGPVLVAFSGGKDSVAMVLHLLEIGIPKHRIHLHHHLVDGAGSNLFDWPCTESYCRAFAKAFELKLLFSYRQGGIAREILRHDEPLQDVYFQRVPDGPFEISPSNKARRNTRLKFPAVSASLCTRWCSGIVKIDVLRTAIARNPDYLGEIFICTGERRQESPARSKYLEIEPHRTNCVNGKRTAMSWRPVIDWTEQEVWQIMARWKVQPHPAYMLGWSRCSCQTCIFNHPDIWATIARISPGKIDTIADLEATTGHTLYHGMTIAEKVRKGTPLADLDPVWVSQGLGEFTMPIIVDTWQLPAGAFRGMPAGSS